jgi:DNA-binding transcriptional regulator YiaG
MLDPSLSERREALGLSRMRLAALLGVDVTTLWRWEVGKQAPPRWLDLALEALESRTVTTPPPC